MISILVIPDHISMYSLEYNQGEGGGGGPGCCPRPEPIGGGRAVGGRGAGVPGHQTAIPGDQLSGEYDCWRLSPDGCPVVSR